MTLPRTSSQPPATALTLFPRVELLSALSHEVANHLTAVRMHAELFEFGRAPHKSSRAVVLTAGRAGLLCACVRPLSEESHTNPRSVLNPIALLDAIRERTASMYDTKFPLELQSCEALRSVRGDLEECTRALSLLAVELHCAADGASPIFLSSSVSRAHIEISLGVQCARLPMINPSQPGGGVVLAMHVADAIARRHGGWLSLHSMPLMHTASLWLPGTEQP